MPTTLIINDPRKRTRSILLDLVDPNRYEVTIIRESVEEKQADGSILVRYPTRVIRRIVTWNGETPTGDPLVLGLLQPITEAVLAMEAADEAAANV